MKTRNKILIIILIPSLLIQSCIVSAPKYSHVEQVMQLKIGMSKDSVSSRLGVEPYDIDIYDSTGYRSFVYKYRTTDRSTIPFRLKETNGKEKIGKYMDLVAYFDSTDIAYRFESRPTDSKVDQKKFNINAIVTIVTVIVPALLVYLGVQSTK
jgi:hypothetical protein